MIGSKVETKWPSVTNSSTLCVSASNFDDLLFIHVFRRAKVRRREVNGWWTAGADFSAVFSLPVYCAKFVRFVAKKNVFSFSKWISCRKIQIKMELSKRSPYSQVFLSYCISWCKLFGRDTFSFCAAALVASVIFLDIVHLAGLTETNDLHGSTFNQLCSAPVLDLRMKTSKQCFDWNQMQIRNACATHSQYSSFRPSYLPDPFRGNLFTSDNNASDSAESSYKSILFGSTTTPWSKLNAGHFPDQPITTSSTIGSLAAHNGSSTSTMITPRHAPVTMLQAVKHQQAPRFQCSECSRSYSTMSGLTKHKQFHCSSQLKRQFGCKFCEKKYSSLG